MSNKLIYKEIEKYLQIEYSLEWGKNLLTNYKDEENSKVIKELQKLYYSKAIELMKANNIKEIEAYVTKNRIVKVTLDNKIK